MADNCDHDSNDARETTYSGTLGQKNRHTPGRTPGELGLDGDELRAHDIVGDSSDRTGDDISLVSKAGGGPRENPDLKPDVVREDGGVSEAGGLAGGARGNAGTSNRGAGGPTGESHGGPGEYTSTSRGDFDRGSD